jgi:hypothetical protein
MALTYTQLKAAVEAYVENTFSATDFATMTRLAEQTIYNFCQPPTLRKATTVSTVIGTSVVNLPADFLYPYELAVVSAGGNYAYLLDKDLSFIRESYPNPVTTGTPAYYALKGPASGIPLVQQIVLAPTPSAVLTLSIDYAAYPESITVASAGTSWLGNNFESVLLNGVLVEAVRFMKQEPDIVALHEKQFKESMLLMKMLADGKTRQDTYREQQVRTKVR